MNPGTYCRDIISGSGDDFTLTTVMGISTSITWFCGDFSMILTLDVVSGLLPPGSRPVYACC